VRTPSILVGLCLLTTADFASAHNLNKKDKVFFIDSPWVERAWTEGDFRIGLDIIDGPGPSSPTPQTGFIFRLPGVKLNLYNRLEVGLDIPFIVNPDQAKGDIIVVDDPDPAKVVTDNADFDIPTIDTYVKFSLIKDRNAKTQAAVGVDAKFGVNNDPKIKAFDGFENLRNPFMTPYELQLRPFVAAAFSRGKFSPQLSVGTTIAQDSQRAATDAVGNALPSTDVWVDWAVSVPYYNSFTEAAIVVGANGRHLASGVSTPFDDNINIDAGILFGGASAAEFGFIAQIPVFSSEYRDFSTFTAKVVYSYNLSYLTIKKDEKKDEKKDTSPNKETPTTAPVDKPTP
jgi:hypothetical protein